MLKIKCKFAEALKEKAISQAEFERMTGVHHTTLKTHRLNTAKRIDYNTLLAMCTVLDKTPGDLLVVEDEK